MAGDPFTAIASFMENTVGSSGKLKIRRGTVLTVEPLTIDVGGITAEGDELQVNAAMLEHLVLIVPTNPNQSSFEAMVTPKLLKGDKVLLLTEDDQLFHVLCKEVGV